MTESHSDNAHAIKAALLKHAEILSVKVIQGDPSIRIELTVRSPSRAWELRLVWQPAIASLPKVFLRDKKEIGTLEHVSYAGEVCHTDNEGLSVDPTRTVDIAVQCIIDSVKTLEQAWLAYSSNDNDELLDEAEGYWNSLPGSLYADLHLPLDSRAREISAYTGSVNGVLRCFGFTEVKKSSNMYGALVPLKHFNRVPALYAPLERHVALPSPASPLTPTMVLDWLSSANAANAVRITRFLKSVSRRVDEAYVVFSQPRPSGGVATFAVGFSGHAGRHPLVAPSSKWRTVPISPLRHDRAYLTERGGGLPNLTSKRVAVIGCGAVGSRVAEFLALAGIGRFILIDPDEMTPDNIFRHVLGGDTVRLRKVTALSWHLKRRLPGLEVEAIEGRCDSWPPAWAHSLDGVILAIGDPYVERHMVAEFHRSAPPGAPLLTAWMEPYGLGGHVVATVAGQIGCLECLYREPSGAPRSPSTPKTIFAEPGQAIGKNLTGCGGAFTPYSAADAAQTALLATRMMLGYLTGEANPRYASWKGSATAFHAAGFRTTPWFNGYNEVDAARVNEEFLRVVCPVCGGRP